MRCTTLGDTKPQAARVSPLVLPLGQASIFPRPSVLDVHTVVEKMTPVHVEPVAPRCACVHVDGRSRPDLYGLIMRRPGVPDCVRAKLPL